MKHLQLYEGFLATYHQKQEAIGKLEAEVGEMTKGLYTKITRFFYRYAQVEPEGKERYEPGWFLTLNRNGIDSLYVQSNEVSFFTNGDDTKVDWKKESLDYIRVEGSQASGDMLQDLRDETLGEVVLVAIWDAIQQVYPEHLEAEEMGFFNKEAD